MKRPEAQLRGLGERYELLSGIWGKPQTNSAFGASHLNRLQYKTQYPINILLNCDHISKAPSH